MKHSRIVAGLFAVTCLLPGISVAWQWLGMVWPDARVEMLVDIPGRSDAGTTWNQAFADAVETWHEAADTFRFDVTRQESHPCAGYIAAIPENGFTNGAGFYQDACGEPFGADTLAVTLSYGDGDGNFAETDIVFNANEDWDVYSGPSRFLTADFRRVAVHELGHVMGLDHEEAAQAIMSPFVGEIEFPTADDIAGVLALYPDVDGLVPILLELEEPGADAVVSGVSNIRGWATALARVERVELWLDGGLLGEVPHGGSRADVGGAYPAYPDAASAGFSMALAWGLLAPGEHTLTARAYDQLGRSSEREHRFRVTSFANPFIADPAKLQVSGPVTVTDPHTLHLGAVSADGRSYTVTLRWSTASQKFEIADISPR